uniref:Uncharacterized protein n=1 Tax=Salix viminalis TaxID=40686 RepID=A0A6N2M724_SALVM
MAAAIVVVFDFDKTIIDVDSDNWVIDELGFTDFNQLLPTMPWNSLMDRMMKELHSDGKTMEDIAEVLKRIPIHSQVISAIKAAHDLGCELRIVSDANMFFIETILKHLGLKDCFSEINTNPGSVDEEGRLRISPHHDFTQSSHGCTLCPSQHVQDYVMPRKNFPAWALISKNPLLVKAEIHEWIDGGEMERVLLQIIERISREEISSNSAQLFSADCKFRLHRCSHGALASSSLGYPVATLCELAIVHLDPCCDEGFR